MSVYKHGGYERMAPMKLQTNQCLLRLFFYVLAMCLYDGFRIDNFIHRKQTTEHNTNQIKLYRRMYWRPASIQVGQAS